MVILIWLLFEIILFFSISVINIILKSASYIERSILTYLITAIIYLIFIFFENQNGNQNENDSEKIFVLYFNGNWHLSFS